jgi:hypothetical protein
MTVYGEPIQWVRKCCVHVKCHYANYGRIILNLLFHICSITIYCKKYTRVFSKIMPGCSVRDCILDVPLFTTAFTRSHKTKPQI